MSTERHRFDIDEARARKGHAAYVEGYCSPLVVEAERAYQRLRKRR